MTPLHSSCASGHEEIVSLLLASNADLEVIDKVFTFNFLLFLFNFLLSFFLCLFFTFFLTVIS